MKNLFLLGLVVSSLVVANQTTIPSSIGGALLISPVELHGMKIHVPADQKCKAMLNVGGVECELTGATAVFAHKGESNIVTLHKLLERTYQGIVPGSVHKKYSLKGSWVGNSNGHSVRSPLLIELHEFSEAPGNYKGYVEFQDLYQKISLVAKTE